MANEGFEGFGLRQGYGLLNCILKSENLHDLRQKIDSAIQEYA